MEILCLNASQKSVYPARAFVPTVIVPFITNHTLADAVFCFFVVLGYAHVTAEQFKHVNKFKAAFPPSGV